MSATRSSSSAREQATAGNDVRVISSAFRQHTVAEPGADEARGLAELQAAGVDLVRLPGRQLGHDRTWLRGLRRAIEDHRPDVAHVHGPFSPTTVRAVNACRRIGAGVLVDNHIQEAIAPGSTTALGRTTYALVPAGVRVVAPCDVARRRVGGERPARSGIRATGWGDGP